MRPLPIRILRCFLQTFSVLLLIIGASSMATHGQSYQGGLRGAVYDPAGAVVVGVELSLTNEQTNTTRNAVTNSEGEYAFANVLPGVYTLTVTKAGYKKYEHKTIRISTQEFITLDVKLAVGQTTESVTISSEAAVLESSNPSIATTLETRALQDLPTPARNVFFLSVATPSVVPTGDPQFVRQQDQTNSSLLSLGGGPRRANNYTIDGVSITDLRNRPVFIPNIESVQEVRVQVSTYDAEMGRTGGGVLNATAKSGGNDWHGSGVFQNRPSFASSQLFFAKRANTPKPETYYYLYGGSFGGPIIKDRTFFWASSENYKTLTSRNAVLTLPTQLELTGDFRQSGITIYDPLTTGPNPSFDPSQPESPTNFRFIRSPFPDNIIPLDRINPVAKEVLKYFPNVPSGTSSTAELKDRANQATGKAEHRWSDKFTTTGFYGWYDSAEPEARFYAKNLGENPGDPAEGQLFRTVHAVAINNIITISNNTVFAFRYGFTQFVDDDIPNQFDPVSLGLSTNFLSAIPYKKFPRFAISGYGTVNFDTFGDRDPQDTTFYGHNISASVSKLFGSHTLKGGFDYRIIGMKLFARGQPSGRFSFDPAFTRGPDPLVGGTLQHSLSSFLLGFPSSGDMTIGTPNNFYINYYAGYVHDDFRVGPNLTLNMGLRYEFEQGLQERDNLLTVGFSRDKAFPVQVPGLNLKGGLLYAGVDGAPTHQGDPSKTKFAPRVGLAYKFSDKVVLRGGYGIYYAPNQYAFPNENRMGTRGFTAVTTYVASTDGGLTPCTTCTLTNPFPNGVESPAGSSLGLRTGVGGDIHFVDQFRESAYLHQYSADLQYELARGSVVSAGYVGARTERLSVGGTNSNTVNINQLDRSFLSRGASLLEPVTNPMFGNAAFGALGRQATVPRGQLLRPFPQFRDIFAHQVSGGFARYDSMVLRFERRITRGWGANINYTFSRNRDNLFGEVNYFSNNSNGLARALDNYDLKAEFAPSVIDAPHRLNISGVYELPFGRGKKYLDKGGPADWFLGGWQVAAIGSYQSGFPVVIAQNNNNSGLFGSYQRPNLVAGQDPKTSGGTEDRLDQWFNPAAWSEAAPFTFGNALRTDTRARTPIKANWDIAFQKNQRLSEKFTLQLRAEIINVFNDANFLGPATLFGRSDFGRITQVGGFPRLLQWMARVQF